MGYEKTSREIEQLQEHVQALLDSYCNQEQLGFTLKVLRDYTQQEGWLYLAVVPDKGGIRVYDYAKALTDVENKLRREEHVEHVLLLPDLAA